MKSRFDRKLRIGGKNRPTPTKRNGKMSTNERIKRKKSSNLVDPLDGEDEEDRNEEEEDQIKLPPAEEEVPAEEDPTKNPTILKRLLPSPKPTNQRELQPPDCQKREIRKEFGQKHQRKKLL